MHLQIAYCCFQSLSVVVKKTERPIAVMTKKSTDLSGSMIMVYNELGLVTFCVHNKALASANCTLPILFRVNTPVVLCSYAIRTLKITAGISIIGTCLGTMEM